MLIEFDDDGNSVGRSWPVEDPELRAHLEHLATHLGDPATLASNVELSQTYRKIE
jgi:hypothetical protein